MDGEGINSGCKMLSMDLGKFLSPAVVFVIDIHHLIRHLSGANAMDFEHLMG